MAPSAAASPDAADNANIDAPELRVFVMGLFFLFGGITSLNDVIIPKLKDLFTLNFTQAMLVQFCFFTAYLVIGIPGAALVKRIGYKGNKRYVQAQMRSTITAGTIISCEALLHSPQVMPTPNP
jgi:hypothetical protein